MSVQSGVTQSSPISRLANSYRQSEHGPRYYDLSGSSQWNSNSINHINSNPQKTATKCNKYSTNFKHQNTESCSAMHSWLQLSGDIEKTVASSHTLFAPYKYRIKRTEIVLLDVDDNPCELNGIKNSNIAGKMVLLYSKSYFSLIKSSDHQQLFVMQENNVSAVIMSSIDDTLSVIKDDEFTIDIDSYIPMRGITLNIANEIKTLIENGNIIYGEFNCNDSYKYPLEMCINNIGLDIYGNFILQTKWNDNNGHPIWMRQGYSSYNMYNDLYLYLIHGNGNNYWYWAITNDINMQNENDIIAYCNNEQNIENNSLIFEPTQCTQWMKYNTINSEWILSDMNIYLGICNVSNNYFCISSTQSILAGLSGTYRLYYELEPIWFRERDNCDNSPGIFTYDSHGTFYLLDPIDNWKIAFCWIGDQYKDVYENILKFRPDLCTEWRSIIDGSLDDTLINDNTLQIKQQIDCSINCTYNYYHRWLPNRLCIQKNSIMHSFLEGNYTYTGIRGNKYLTKEYKLNKSLIYNGKIIHIYLWYFGELNDKYKWWVISSNNLSIAQQINVNNGLNYSWIYGYNACSVRNVINCNSNWNFYWSYAWHNDVEFMVNRGWCANENITEINYNNEIYDYICIDSIIDNDRDNKYYDIINMVRGGYKKMDSFNTYITGNNTPIWRKPINDITDMDMYIYYDKFYGYWQIGYGYVGTNVTIFNSILICHNNNILYPEKCNEWYDFDSQSFGNIIYLKADGCTHKDMLNITTNDDNNNILSVIVIVFIVIVVLTICSIIIYCSYLRFYKKSNNNYGNNNSNNKHSEMYKTRRKRHKQLANQDSNDDSNTDDGVLTGISSKETYDMTPLQNTNDQQYDNNNEMDDTESGGLMTKY